jgi:site-specific recombinase XerD
VIIPDALFAKLAKFYKYKHRRAESLGPGAPLFLSQRGARIALRSLRHVFARWQKRAHFERKLGFHTLRHTAASAVYHRHKDPLLVQRFARHTSLRTTSIYMHAGDEEVMQALRGQPC